MQKWRVLLIILLVLLIGVVGFKFWLLNQPLNNKVAETNNNIQKSEAKVSCEWEGKTHESKKPFLVWLSDGCSLCFCGGNSSITCQKVPCPEGGRND